MGKKLHWHSNHLACARSDWTEGLLHLRHTGYHWASAPALLLFYILWENKFRFKYCLKNRSLFRKPIDVCMGVACLLLVSATTLDSHVHFKSSVFVTDVSHLLAYCLIALLNQSHSISNSKGRKIKLPNFHCQPHFLYIFYNEIVVEKKS
jgi:hypothetical protein